MGPTRFPYGKALGFVNQFNYRSTTAGDISGSATPDVTLGELFYCNNTGSVTITNFILQDTANRLANYEGKVIRVWLLDNGSTQLANASPLILNGSDNLAGSNSSIELLQSRGSWYDLGKTRPNTNGGFATFTGAGSGGTINVNGINTVVFQGTALTVFTSLSGGQVGQTVYLWHNTAGITFQITSAGNIAIAGTNAIVLRANDLFQATKLTGTQWVLQRDNL